MYQSDECPCSLPRNMLRLKKWTKTQLDRQVGDYKQIKVKLMEHVNVCIYLALRSLSSLCGVVAQYATLHSSPVPEERVISHFE